MLLSRSKNISVLPSSLSACYTTPTDRKETTFIFKTRITELLGIKYPIIQGGMVYLSRAELTAAVSNAGGLGIITSVNMGTKEEFRDELRKVKSLTDRPFGVNINLALAHRHPTPGIILHSDQGVQYAAVGMWGNFTGTASGLAWRGEVIPTITPPWKASLRH